MGITVLFIAICIVFGLFAAVASRGPIEWPAPSAQFLQQDVQRFSPRRTLFIFGPDADHPGCKLQRRLLKPAIAFIIREEIRVFEVYADDQPRQNGEKIDWLDPALLRHAMDAETGFALIYVDDTGRTTLRSDAPMVARDIFAHAGMQSPETTAANMNKSAVLKKLSAA